MKSDNFGVNFIGLQGGTLQGGFVEGDLLEGGLLEGDLLEGDLLEGGEELGQVGVLEPEPVGQGGPHNAPAGGLLILGINGQHTYFW